MTDSEFNEPPSKSARKRQMHQLQQFALQLAKLSPAVFNKLQLPLELTQAINEYKKITSHNAKLRQAQFLGKLIRRIDYQGLLERYYALQTEQSLVLRDVQNWQARLLEQGHLGLSAFIARYPTVDRQTLRRFVNNAIREKSQPDNQGNSNKAQNALFAFLAKQIDPCQH